MDLEQIIQRLEWLDEQRRKDRAQISELQNRLANYEGQHNVLVGRIKTLEAELADLKSLAPRLGQFDQAIEKQRADTLKMFAERDKRTQRQWREAENRWQTQVDDLSRRIRETANRLDVLPEIQSALATLDQADQRLRRDLSKLEGKLGSIFETLDDLQRAQRILDENRRQDLKRVADLQGEIAAVRRRVEEVREKIDLASDTAKMLDMRINALMAAEEERRRAQLEFIESQSRRQAEHERAWKDMQTRFQAFADQAASLDTQLGTIQETHRQVKRALDQFTDINQRLERRITEITEMQRLAEDRMRQEWVAFKADDQKRWTSYTLTSDAQYKDLKEQLQKTSDRITELMDELQTQRDLFDQASDAAEAQLQALMNWAHQWLESFSQRSDRP